MVDKYFLVLCGFLISLADSNFRHYGSGVNCSPIKSSIRQLAMKKMCYRTIKMEEAVAAFSLHPSDNNLESLTSCMKCPVTIETPEHHFRLSVLVYSLETEISRQGACNKFRLEIFNGKRTSDLDLLTESGGLCGTSLPATTYVSSGNTITIQLSTECSKKQKLKRLEKQKATFNLVVSKLANNATRTCPGQFQCDDGLACYDMSRVCDDVTHCLDQSDEKNCPARKKVGFPHWMIAMVVMATLSIVAFIVVASVFAIQYCVKSLGKGYSKV